MKARSSTLWTIQQLCDEVSRALAVGYAGTPNGRVRDVPDLRTIRYYTTIGLLDRPAEMRGRTALYGPRHLLQLVAIKKLQARGQSLSQIQQAMAGATDTMLRRLAGEMAGPGGEPTDEPTRPARPVKPRSFWKSRPAPIPTREPQGEAVPESRRSSPKGRSRLMCPGRPSRSRPSRWWTGSCSCWPRRGPIDPAALREIREAAAPLIQCLRKHQLIQSTSKGEGDVQADSPVD